MKIILNGKINKVYAQNLCMLFFHGEKFHSDENSDKELIISAYEKDKFVYASAEMTVGEKKAFGEGKTAFDGQIKIDRAYNLSVGKAVLSAGNKITGKSIPWGTSTGIRPSRIAAELLNENSVDDTVRILKDEYLIREDKAKLSVEVALNENKIMSYSNNKNCSIYISVPFCPSRCSYCSFISYATPKLYSLIPSYTDKLIVQLRDTFRLIGKYGYNPISIYIGGGTPTFLSAEQLRRLLCEITSLANVKNLLEYTLEGGRPDTITEEKLKIAKEFGVNRISVNPQSLNDKVLENIGRKHTVADFYKAYETVKKYDFDCVNTDLIVGLKGDTVESFSSTVDRILDLAPDNITVHSLCAKNSSVMVRNNSDDCIFGEKIADECICLANVKINKNGYKPYYLYRQKNTVGNLENTGYGNTGKFGIYNVLMMSDDHTVFGVGSGSTTKIVFDNNGKTEIKRIFSPKYPYEYLQDKKNICILVDNFLKEEK